MNAHKGTRFAVGSGTITTRSIKDYSHLCDLSLGDGSPLPLHYPEVLSWAKALDVSDFPAPIGELRQLCKPGEHVREGFKRRLMTTKGVVASLRQVDCAASIVVSERVPPTIPSEVRDAMRAVDESWDRPDGEKFVDAITKAACMRQLASGFWYRFIYPRNEPKELRAEWFRKRQEWRSELREKLKRAKPHLDSPLLCTKAAIRFHAGKEPTPGSPVWAAECWPAWRDIREAVQPETEAVWISDWLARDAAEWGKKNPGIIWYSWNAFGEKIAELSGLPHYGGGTKASAEILKEVGDRAIVASLEAQGVGKNLQVFSRMLFANVPPSGNIWEQAIGRCHRPGQEADAIDVQVYQHTAGLEDAFARAKEDAEYAANTITWNPPKLCLAQILMKFDNAENA